MGSFNKFRFLLLIATVALLPIGTLANNESKPNNLLSFLEPEGSTTHWGFHFDMGTISLSDSADSLYIGEFDTGWGIGGRYAVLFPLSEGIKWGGNFNFTWNTMEGDVYSLDAFNPGFGPILEVEVGTSKVLAHFNYNMGWADTIQEAESCSDVICPSGSNIVNIRGWEIGVEALIPVDNMVVGPYLAIGSQSFIDFPYNDLNQFTSSYELKGINIDTTYTHIGVTVEL
ncbi:hypothetical protein HOH87_00725 [bacterium]|jgi:hypothetical protein|nr:hypothetical protein [bacterium]